MTYVTPEILRGLDENDPVGDMGKKAAMEIERLRSAFERSEAQRIKAEDAFERAHARACRAEASLSSSPNRLYRSGGNR